jgi:hypothetical protein
VYDKITNIDAEIERQRSIDHCGEYIPIKRQSANLDVYIDPCANKPCFAKCTFDVFISCNDNELHAI